MRNNKHVQYAVIRYRGGYGSNDEYTIIISIISILHIFALCHNDDIITPATAPAITA
jgi:hypothetical protein